MIHTYDRIVPYVGHKKLTVVTTPPTVFRVRPSVLYREYDRIQSKYRPWIYYSPTNHYLNSDSAVVRRTSVAYARFVAYQLAIRSLYYCRYCFVALLTCGKNILFGPRFSIRFCYFRSFCMIGK